MGSIRILAAMPMTAIAVAGVVGDVRAGGDKVVFPTDYDKGVLYTTIDRADIKQYRELFTTPEAIDALQAGKPMPSGTVLTLVQYKAKLDAAGKPGEGAWLRHDGRGLG